MCEQGSSKFSVDESGWCLDRLAGLQSVVTSERIRQALAKAGRIILFAATSETFPEAVFRVPRQNGPLRFGSDGGGLFLQMSHFCPREV